MLTMQWQMHILSYLHASTKYNIYKLPKKQHIIQTPYSHRHTRTFLQRLSVTFNG